MKENDIIIDSIKNTINDIAYDKNRLNKIIEAINNGDVTIDINDRLINNLNSLEVDNDVIQTALEYLTLILSNLESQKINNTKNITSEMITILTHVLNGVRNLEHCALQLTTEIDTHKQIIEKYHNTNSNTTITTDKNISAQDKFSWLSFFRALAPNNKISNIVVWLMGFILFLSILFKLDPVVAKQSVDEVNHMVHRIEGVKNDK